MRFRLLIVFLSVNLLSYSQGEEELIQIDSLRSIVNSKSHDSLRINALMEWDGLIYMSDPKLDIELNQQTIELCEKHLSWSMPINELTFYAECKAIACNSLGLALINFADYSNALRSLRESLELAQLLKLDLSMSNAYNNIALVYKQQKEYDKALEYFEKSVAFDFVEDEDLGAYHNNVGLCYSDLSQHEKALLHYDTSIEMSSMAGDEWTLANAMANSAYAWYLMDQPDTAILQFNAVEDTYRRIDDDFGLSFVKYATGKCYLKMGQMADAIRFCSEGLKLAENTEFLEREVDNCGCLYEAYRSSGDKSTALEYHELLKELEDSLYRARHEKELMLNDTQIEFKQRRLSDSLRFAAQQSLDHEKHEAEISAKREQQKYLYVGLAMILIIALIVLRSYYLKKKDNKLIASQKEEVERQNIIVEHKNREITDSINYAKTIQDALLPSESKMKRALKDYFVLYLPKDIVAGDFYWAEAYGGKLFIAVADCTGHGVPGAMVAVLCHNALTRSIKEFGLTDPAMILDQCRKLIAEDFSESDRQVNDGMDIALCVVDKNEILYAGANNNLLLLRDSGLKEFVADKQPVGLFQRSAPFRCHRIRIDQNDIIYLFSDGFPDQFGGEKGKKYKYAKFKEYLLQIHKEKLETQGEMLRSEILNWRGELEQIDDICVMGVKLT